MTDKQYREIISNLRIIIGMLFVGYGDTQGESFPFWLGIFIIGTQLFIDFSNWYFDRRETKLAELRNDN